MTKIIVDISSFDRPIIISRLEYVCAFIGQHPCAPFNTSVQIGSETGDILIQYGNSEPVQNAIRIHDAGLCFGPDIIEITSVTLKNMVWNGLIFSGFCLPQYEGDLFPIDVFQTIFFHISRYEEWYYKRPLDRHGMMNTSHHFLVNERSHSTPLVDHLVYYFYSILGLNPIKRETTYSLSHDIDVIQKFPSFSKFLRSAGNIMLYRKHKILSLLRLLKSYLTYRICNTKDPYDTFVWLLIDDNPAIVEKKIYFLCGGKTKYDHFFDISDQKAAAIIQLAKENKYSIGIHPSYDSDTNEKIFTTEKTILEKASNNVVTDSRQHFLRYSIHHTGEILDRAGIKTDSSIGYRDKIGFRAGTGFPYRMYNFNQEKAFDFVEIPMVIMDGAAMEEAGWNSDEFIKLISKFLEKNRYYTQITFNFHNSFFDPALTDSDKLIDFYKELFCGPAVS